MSKFFRSSVLIVYQETPELKVVFVKRTKNQRAFPEHWVFPGGKVDADDHHVPKDCEEGSLEDQDLIVCALRECFEETGILPGYQGERSLLQEYRQQLANQELPFSEICQKLNYTLPLSQCINLGHRVTPPISPYRFDTLYVLLKEEQDWEVDVGPYHGELETGDWLTPQEIIRQWQQAQMFIPPPTRDVIAILEADGITPESLERIRSLATHPESTHRRIQYHPGITFIPLRTPTLPPATHTNCCLIGQEQFFIADPASPYPEDQEVLFSEIEDRIQAGHKPLGILLTHHHQDHIGGVKAVKERFSLAVFAHPITAELCQAEFQVEQLLEDGQILELGQDPLTGKPWQIQAIFTPGHAPGHLCYVDLRYRAAIVGDMVAGIGTILIAPPEGHMQTYLNSLQHLIDLNLSLIFPAHGNAIVQPSQYFQFYIKHRLEREQKVVNSLSNAPNTLDELLPLAYDDITPDIYPLAAQSLLAHLIKLMEEKRVIKEDQLYRLVS